MSAASGIPVSDELVTAFSNAVSSQGVRFLKIGIRNETLVLDKSIPRSGTIEHDLDKMADLLEDDVPAYILARMDDPSSEWLAISYVPDTARVRDKMLYASSRSSLTKQLGATHFKDSLFANSKSDVTGEAYKKHKLYSAAPKPLNAREKEMAEIKAAERTTSGVTYDNSRTVHGQFNTGAGYTWSQEVKDAVSELPTREASHLVVIAIQVDSAGESLVLVNDIACDANNVGSALPVSDPTFAFFYWIQEARKDIVFIYSCPSSSSVKNRMLYSTGALAVHRAAKVVLGDSASLLAARKIETSDPKELNENLFTLELGSQDQSAPGSGTATPQPSQAERPSFARPKGPGRKR